MPKKSPSHPSVANNGKSHDELTTTEFANEIREQLEEGFAFVPFVGSGISARSGILMSSAFSEYLAYCVWRTAFSNNKDKEEGLWDLMTYGWPPYPHDKDLKNALTALCDEFECLGRVYSYTVGRLKSEQHLICRINHTSKDGRNLEKQLARPLLPWVLRSSQPSDKELNANEESLWQQKCFYRIPNEPSDPNCSPSSPAHIRELAIRSLAHWTTTLEFLSSLRLVRESGKTNLVLGSPNPLLIDTFNQHITRGRKPNIIHNLLARLAPALRTHLILTTNFDTLTEEAFAAQGEPLHTIAVSSRGSLPPMPVVRPQNCLIKLHGDLIETRADSSINQPPSPEDLKCFHEYLNGPPVNGNRRATFFLPSHLLVMGYSASDPRCVKMIKYVLDFSNSVKVFWVSHNNDSADKVKSLFSDYIRTSPERFRIVKSDRTDLLLWELFQTVALSLPGGGYPFKFAHNVPPLRSSAEILNQNKIELKDYLRNRKASCNKSIRLTQSNVLSIDYGRGMSLAMRELFEDFTTRGIQTLWMELEDHRNTLAVLTDVLGAITLRMGSFQTGPANFLPDLEFMSEKTDPDVCVHPDFQDEVLALICERIKLLCANTRIVRQNWALFFYARNGPGGCSSWALNYWSQKECRFFERLLSALSKTLSFRVIYMPFGQLRYEANESKVGIVARQARHFFGDKAHSQNIPGYEEYLKMVDTSADPDGGFRSPVRVAPFHEENALTTSLFHSPGADLWGNLQKRDTDLALERTDHETEPKLSRYEHILGRVLGEFLGFPQGGIESHTIDSRFSVRIHWLYGMTLFRQSRHAAAKISEAIFPCPWKFHLEKSKDGVKDNDMERYRWVIKGVDVSEGGRDDADKIGWSNWLESTGLLLRKPGGYSWKYRDTRLGLQQLLELSGEIPHYDKPFSEYPIPKRQAHLWQLKPRFHYLIGEWYWRAFQSTGHYSPLNEAVFHAAQTVILAKNLSVSDRADENCHAKIRICWYAICLIRRCVRHGATCLNFWTPGANLRADFLGDLEKIRLALTDLQFGDGGYISGALYQKLLDVVKVGGVLEHEINTLVSNVLSEGLPRLPKPNPFPSNTRVDQAHTGAKQIDITAKLLDLFKETRSGESSESKMESFKTLYNSWAAEWLEKSADAAGAYDLAWELSTLINKLIRISKLKYHVTATSKNIQQDTLSIREIVPEEDWRVVSFICYYALKICRFLSPEYFRQETELRVRLLTSYGLALGCLGRSSEAKRRFNEAHALALLSPSKDGPLQITRIELRRAENHIYRYYQVVEKIDQKGMTSAMGVSTGQEAMAAIDDAWAAIERGEEASSGKLHSSYWLYRVAVTKLSCLTALADACKRLNADPLGSLPLRRRQHLPNEIERLLVDALFSANGDLFRELRAIDYAVKASNLRSWRTMADEQEYSLGSAESESLLQPYLAPFAKPDKKRSLSKGNNFSNLKMEQKPLYRHIAKILALNDTQVRDRAEKLPADDLLSMYESVMKLVRVAAGSQNRK